MAVIVSFFVSLVFIWMFRGFVFHKEIQPSFQQVCMPFNAHIIWDQSKENDAYAIQLHYVLQVINRSPKGTNIRLDTVDEKLRNIIDTIKENDKSKDLIDKITNIDRGISENSIIPYDVLQEAISNSFKESQATAEEIFFIVHDKSEIDDEVNAIRFLSKRKVFVVYHGTESQISKFWTKLATDKHHVLKPNENIGENVDAFLNLLCQDSRLFCDTDMYWNGTNCFRCSFICSQIRSEYCQNECPYFDRFTRDVDKLDELPASHGFKYNDTKIVIILTAILLLQFIVFLKVVVPVQVSNLLQRILNKQTEVPLDNVVCQDGKKSRSDNRKVASNKNDEQDSLVLNGIGGHDETKDKRNVGGLRGRKKTGPQRS